MSLWKSGIQSSIRAVKHNAVQAIQMRRNTNRLNLNCGQRDRCEIGSGEYLQHSEGDKVRRAISPEASGLHSTQLKVNGWSVFPHTYTLFKTPGSLLSKAFQTQEPQRGLLKQYLLVFQWDSRAPKKFLLTSRSNRSLLLHRCLIKTGTFFFLGDYYSKLGKCCKH